MKFDRFVCILAKSDVEVKFSYNGTSSMYYVCSYFTVEGRAYLLGTSANYSLNKAVTM